MAPEQAEREASLVSYAAALAEEGGGDEAVAQAEALRGEGVTPEEVAATVALLVYPDLPAQTGAAAEGDGPAAGA